MAGSTTKSLKDVFDAPHSPVGRESSKDQHHGYASEDTGIDTEPLLHSPQGSTESGKLGDQLASDPHHHFPSLFNGSPMREEGGDNHHPSGGGHELSVHSPPHHHQGGNNNNNDEACIPHSMPFGTVDGAATSPGGGMGGMLHPLHGGGAPPATNMHHHHHINHPHPHPPHHMMWGGVRHPGDKPKRPLSAYNFFFQLERERIIKGDEKDRDTIVKYTVEDVARIALIQQKKAKENKPKEKRSHRKTHGKISFGDLARTIANKWKKLDDPSKSIFEGSASIEKERYRKELGEWNKQQKKWKEATAKMTTSMAANTTNMAAAMYDPYHGTASIVTPTQLPKKTVASSSKNAATTVSSPTSSPTSSSDKMMATLVSQQKKLLEQNIAKAPKAAVGPPPLQVKSQQHKEGDQRFMHRYGGGGGGMLHPRSYPYNMAYGGMYEQDYMYDNFDEMSEDTYQMAQMTLPPRGATPSFHQRMMMNQRHMRMMMMQQQQMSMQHHRSLPYTQQHFESSHGHGGHGHGHADEFQQQGLTKDDFAAAADSFDGSHQQQQQQQQQHPSQSQPHVRQVSEETEEDKNHHLEPLDDDSSTGKEEDYTNEDLYHPIHI